MRLNLRGYSYMKSKIKKDGGGLSTASGGEALVPQKLVGLGSNNNKRKKKDKGEEITMKSLFKSLFGDKFAVVVKSKVKKNNPELDFIESGKIKSRLAVKAKKNESPEMELLKSQVKVKKGKTSGVKKAKIKMSDLETSMTPIKKGKK